MSDEPPPAEIAIALPGSDSPGLNAIGTESSGDSGIEIRGEAGIGDEGAIATDKDRRKWQFLLTVGSAFGIVALQLGQGILLARLLGPEGRGEYATAIFYVQFLLYIGLFGGLKVVCRYATGMTNNDPGTEDRLAKERSALSRSALRLSLVTGTITALVVIMLSVAAMPSDKHHLIPLAVLCAISVLGQHVMLMMTGVDRGSGHFGRYNIRRIIAAAAFPVLLGVAALWTSMTVTLACLLFIAASVISVVVCLAGLDRPLAKDYDPPVKRLLRESRPYGLSMLASDLFERLDLLLVLWLAPFVEQGYYTTMIPAVYPLIVIPNTLGMFLFNAAAGRRFTTRDVHRVLGSSIAIQTVITIVFMLLIGYVVELVYGDKFIPAVEYALWLAPASAIKGILQGLESYLKGRGRPLAPVFARIASAVVLLISAAFLYPFHGVISIAMAAVVAQAFCLVWLAAIMYADCRRST